MKPVLLFDVNETLLDLTALDALFADRLGNAALRPLWFAQMLQLSFVGGLTGEYVSFTDAQLAALGMVATRSNLTISEADKHAIVDSMSSLPPHSDVPDALLRLKNAGFRMATLTNSVAPVAEAQIRNAGLEVFDQILSADTVRQLKPGPAPYVMAAEAFGVPTSETCLVAAHSWDISGALAAGCAAAFVARPGAVLSPLGAQPTIIGKDVAEVADALVNASGA
jgi:2-haloacid dehalogenase